MDIEIDICVAVETAVAGGSLALFKDHKIFDQVSGSDFRSRAEDLLPNIHQLLSSNGIEKSSISRIVISSGPGSYTGLRIGFATVLGLSRALGVESVGIPLFTAIGASVNDDRPYLLAIPMGRNDICFAVQGPNDASGLRVGSLEDLNETITAKQVRRVFAHAGLVKAIAESMPGDAELCDLGDNMASYLGRAGVAAPANSPIAPIYVSNPRFG